MLAKLQNIFHIKPDYVAEQWFGPADYTQQLSENITYKEWNQMVSSEILQIYYNRENDFVSIKTISQSTNLQVNDIVHWGDGLNERLALDYLVQTLPKNYLMFHPDPLNLSFNNQMLN